MVEGTAFGFEWLCMSVVFQDLLDLFTYTVHKIEVIHIPLRSRDRLISRKGFEMLHSSFYSQKLENLAWSSYGGYHLLHMVQV